LLYLSQEALLSFPTSSKKRLRLASQERFHSRFVLLSSAASPNPLSPWWLLLSLAHAYQPLPKVTSSSLTSALGEGHKKTTAHYKQQIARSVLKRALRYYALPSRQPGVANHYGYAATNFLASLKFALAGLSFAWQQERNLKIDTALAALTVAAGLYLNLSLSAWVPVVLVLGLVLFAELANTILEWLVDVYTQGRYDERAKHIKDMAAGACLVMAITGLVVVVFSFWPYVASKWF
jgi:diacylglycerol kinase